MIRHFEVRGLNDHVDADLDFHEDLNILTGRNGSGKTSLLKLLWYILSGHFDLILSEIPFESFYFATDEVEVRANATAGSSDSMVLEWNRGDGWTKKTFTPDRLVRPLLRAELSQWLAYSSETSLFFPTFRRIEGGFTPRRGPLRLAMRTGRGEMGRLQEAMQDLSVALSYGRHKFIASISTHDIVDLLTREYADVSEFVNKLHEELSASITSRIADYSEDEGESDIVRLHRATDILRSVENEVVRISKERDLAFQPFSVLSVLIGQVFQYRGIQVTDAVTLGEAAEAISSDQLSAGEKQMLSFLCYNAFTRNAIIFIDEPELSLHPDWQRRLFPTLLDQGTNNQFIVATHSPFIYSKYPDKELILATDRGDSAEPEWTGVE
jgi:energy-coupling factor transporter ATP-binding protein EcfA2